MKANGGKFTIHKEQYIMNRREGVGNVIRQHDNNYDDENVGKSENEKR